MFNKSNIKPYKGSRVKVRYTWNGAEHDLAGKITVSGDSRILFQVNPGEETKGQEIQIRYENILEIKKMKSFTHNIRNIEQLIKETEYQKAIDKIDLIIGDFKLEGQIKELKQLRQECINNLWNEKKTKNRKNS